MDCPKKILLVEEDQRFREALTTFLQASFDVLAPVSASEALRQIAHRPRIDLLVTSLEFQSETNGFDLGREFRSRYSSAPIVLVTALALNSTPSIREFLKLSNSHFAQKPFKGFQLQNLLQGLLRNGSHPQRGMILDQKLYL
jgi:DNA-binding response OmpR family regulator